ncbi:MAG: chromosome segregation protein SMC [Longibaculum muris]|uniref:Chromosome partition protein Smc n=1 Tax=Longibaculum muris TaxID=1796628 RepID=A0A4R3YYL2_9FIRM|nr:chromosome segregation protein SMC [Longibaculum muris]KXU47931.1 segregation protein SMC [Candidatus Stoquefichus sp. KLE1796]MCR1888691.1 chromosome segregation protein SMC [Longibaculum muris]MED9812712.1 chromosome segregation protein SMC [Longibaculum muris]TCV96968.1 chromosome segregation protein [Longibaculum muris]
MYLKKIELHGFKSFADKSVIEFQPGITGIVGPNGCGKSNISDAVRWVLGEQSVKSLRGSNMSDVIFNGSEDRKAQSVAEVTLVFDNEDRFMNFDYNEVEITRRLYRQNNEAEYLINREPCRLKDIIDLIMDTGLGRDSLSIISQGNISSFADSKPEERRGMFEEAAGVAKYKKRKLESIRKLERTKDNLDRVEDICLELEKQIAPLRRQKEKAEVYLELKDQLQSIEVSVLVKEIENLSASLKELNDSLDSLDKEKVTIEGQILLNEQQNETLKKKMYDLDQEVNGLQGQLLTAMNNVNELETQKVEIDTNRKHILENTDKEDLQARIAQMRAILQDAVNEYNDRVNRYKETKEEKLDLEAAQEKNRSEMMALRQNIENLNLQLHNNRNRREQLVDIVENKSGYSYGVRSIMKAKDSLSGIIGVLGDLLESDAQYETALTTALAGAVQFIVTKTDQDAREAIHFLKENKSGRATFLPVEVMKPRSLRDDHLMVCQNFDGYLGVMSDFVRYPQEIESVVLNQLGNIILVDTLKHASALSRATFARYKVVTMDGEVVNIGGSLTGGTNKSQSSNFASKRELEMIKETIVSQEKEINHKKAKLNELDNLAREISHHLLQKQMSFAKLEVVVTNKKSELQVAKSEYESLTHRSVELSEIESGAQDNQLINELNEAKKLRDRLTESIQAKRELRMSFVNENDKLEETLRASRAHLREIQSEMTQKQVNKAKQETELSNYLLRLNDEYKMTYEFAKEEYTQEINMGEAKENVRLLRHKIDSLGNVNLQAIEDYQEVSTRYETLNSQRLDLINAQDSILKAIDEMDEIMISRFGETFEKINKEFNIVFRNLFGGGKAELRYSDPDNILETGIDIDVQPPGKAVQNITLFSGGEKALIAISCLFAILRVRPVPMCILDEVEAALDVANVERFAKYLREFSTQTQFIVVTHREGTMEECDLLYGATMQQKGVTKLVSVKLKDAIDLAGA